MVERLFIHVIEAADELEELEAGETFVKAAAFGDVANALFNSLRVLGDVHAVDEDLAVRRRENAGQHFDGRAFAGAVAAKVTENLPVLDLEGNVVHGGKTAIELGELGNADVHASDARIPLLVKFSISSKSLQNSV